MKILQLRSNLIENGPATQLKTLSDQFIRDGHDVVIASGGGVFADKLEELGYNHRRITTSVYGNRSLKKQFRVFRDLLDLMEKSQFDLVISHNMNMALVAFLCNLLNRIRLKFSAVARITNMVHGIDYNSKIRNIIYLLPIRYIAISTFTYNWMRKLGVPKHRINLIPNGVDASVYNFDLKDEYRFEIRSQYRIPEDAIVIGIVGRMGIKGHDLLIKALPKLLETGEKVHALVVGTGDSYDEHVELAKNLGVDDKITFTGLRLDSYKLYPAMDIYALLSIKGEMLPISILEAMAYKLPVVASELSGIPEILTEKTGILIKPGALSEIEVALSSLVKDAEHRSEMGRSGYQRFDEKFNIKITANQILEFGIN